jgi:hypothetical protein
MTLTLKRVLLLGVAVLFAFSVLAALASPAKAQTYVRPSKGVALQIFSMSQNTAVATSQTYDWTSFTATAGSMRWAQPNGTTGCACPAGNQCTYEFVVKVLGSPAKTGPFYEVDSFGAKVPISGVAAQDGFTVGLTNISVPYIQFQMYTGEFRNQTTSTNIATPCNAFYSVTPTPFTFRQASEGLYNARTILPGNGAPVILGGSDYLFDGFQNTKPYMVRVNEDGALAVTGGAGAPILPTTANYGAPSPFAVAASPNPATQVWEFGGATMGTRSGLRLENVGAQPVYCAAGTASSNVSLTNYAFSLKKPAVAGDGSGGTIDISQFSVRFVSSGDATKVYCIAPAAGASSVAVMAY